MKLIERFTTVGELEAFLQTEAGRVLLASYSPKPLTQIAMTAQVGVWLVVLGLGILAVALGLANGKLPIAVGAVIVAAGCGLLASAAVGRRLLKSWGVVVGPSRS